jgi:AcrR family transcriptional regulator/DNA-binding MarR family transcriptional regulator
MGASKRSGAPHAGSARRTVARPVQPPTAVDKGSQNPQIAEIQRARLLAAAVKAVEDLGYANTTVSHITRRARVSRRTFYELFANRDECLATIFEDSLRQIASEIAEASSPELCWRERVRIGLHAILSYLDREPRLARVCIAQALQESPSLRERREQVLAALAEVIDGGRRENARAAQLTPLTAEGLVGATFTIVHARLLRQEREALAPLLGELMGMIVLPYLGVAAARREQTRRAPAPRSVPTPQPTLLASTSSDPLEGVAMRLTYRTARVLGCVAEHPCASNRQVAEYAGIADQGQVSKLLARLERLALLANTGEGHQNGEPNAWVLTAKGQQVAQNIRMPATQQRAA